MSKELSYRHREILSIINDKCNGGGRIRRVYTVIKAEIYPKPYRYIQRSKQGNYRIWIGGDWIYSNEEVKRYQNSLNVVRSSLSRAVRDLIRRGYLEKQGAWIYITEEGKKYLSVNVSRLNSPVFI
jgi:hypothetical protein